MAQIVPIYMVLNFYFIYNQEYKRYFLNPKKKKKNINVYLFLLEKEK